MSDEADDANLRIELELYSTLKANRLQKPEAYFCGVCLSCKIPVENPKRWCSAECRDSWSLKKKNRIHQ